jgi:hypothetical protein
MLPYFFFTFLISCLFLQFLCLPSTVKIFPEYMTREEIFKTLLAENALGLVCNSSHISDVQGDFESCADILITTYWLPVELGKNV